jgi:threonine dehydrogenase-like Zn-dependent dehydrogenase
METALNAHWDAGTSLGDRILVIGAGVVGLLVAYLARRIAATDVTIVDVDPSRARYAEALGLAFAEPQNSPADNRIVFHTSATGAGLNAAIEACAFEGRVIEMSWYGTHPVTINLGAAFHARRLRIISSQVGHVARSHRSQIKHRDRLQRALALLDDPALDTLVSQSVAFTELPKSLPDIWSSPGLPPVVHY